MSRIPLVSLLMSVRNGQGHLRACLDSLCAQTLDDAEFVVVNDGSTDETGALLAEYAAMEPRLRVLARPVSDCGGLIHALNWGLSEVRGKYVARMDADDVCHPRRLELQAAHLEAEPDAGVVSCLVAYGGDRQACEGYACHVDWLNTLRGHDCMALQRFVESPIANPSAMFRRELAERLGGYRDGSFPEDYEFWLRLFAGGVRFGKVQQELLTWNDPPDRLTRTHPRYSPEAFARIKCEYLALWLQKRGIGRVWVWGAGKSSRQRMEFLTVRGVEIEAYVDIDPRKVGNVVLGRRVYGRNELPGPGGVFVLTAVGSRGARDEIEGFLATRGWIQGRDYLHTA